MGSRCPCPAFLYCSGWQGISCACRSPGPERYGLRRASPPMAMTHHSVAARRLVPQSGVDAYKDIFISAYMVPASKIFASLADPTRLRILMLLRAMELSVGEVAQVLGQSQPRVSRHVKILIDAGLAEIGRAHV